MSDSKENQPNEEQATSFSSYKAKNIDKIDSEYASTEQFNTYNLSNYDSLPRQMTDSQGRGTAQDDNESRPRVSAEEVDTATRESYNYDKYRYDLEQDSPPKGGTTTSKGEDKSPETKAIEEKTQRMNSDLDEQLRRIRKLSNDVESRNQGDSHRSPIENIDTVRSADSPYRPSDIKVSDNYSKNFVPSNTSYYSPYNRNSAFQGLGSGNASYDFRATDYSAIREERGTQHTPKVTFKSDGSFTSSQLIPNSAQKKQGSIDYDYLYKKPLANSQYVSRISARDNSTEFMERDSFGGGLGFATYESSRSRQPSNFSTLLTSSRILLSEIRTTRKDLRHSPTRQNAGKQSETPTPSQPQKSAVAKTPKTQYNSRTRELIEQSKRLVGNLKKIIKQSNEIPIPTIQKYREGYLVQPALGSESHRTARFEDDDGQYGSSTYADRLSSSERDSKNGGSVLRATLSLNSKIERILQKVNIGRDKVLSYESRNTKPPVHEANYSEFYYKRGMELVEEIPIKRQYEKMEEEERQNKLDKLAEDKKKIEDRIQRERQLREKKLAAEQKSFDSKLAQERQTIQQQMAEQRDIKNKKEFEKLKQKEKQLEEKRKAKEQELADQKKKIQEEMDKKQKVEEQKLIESNKKLEAKLEQEKQEREDKLKEQQKQLEEEMAEINRKNEEERIRKEQEEEQERIRQQQEAEDLKRQQEAEELRKQQEQEDLRRQQEEEDLRRQQEEEDLRRQQEQEDEELKRRQQEADFEEELRKQEEQAQEYEHLRSSIPEAFKSGYSESPGKNSSGRANLEEINSFEREEQRILAEFQNDEVDAYKVEPKKPVKKGNTSAKGTAGLRTSTGVSRQSKQDESGNKRSKLSSDIKSKSSKDYNLPLSVSDKDHSGAENKKFRTSDLPDINTNINEDSIETPITSGKNEFSKDKIILGGDQQPSWDESSLSGAGSGRRSKEPLEGATSSGKKGSLTQLAQSIPAQGSATKKASTKKKATGATSSSATKQGSASKFDLSNQPSASKTDRVPTEGDESTKAISQLTMSGGLSVAPSKPVKKTTKKTTKTSKKPAAGGFELNLGAARPLSEGYGTISEEGRSSKESGKQISLVGESPTQNIGGITLEVSSTSSTKNTRPKPPAKKSTKSKPKPAGSQIDLSDHSSNKAPESKISLDPEEDIQYSSQRGTKRSQKSQPTSQIDLTPTSDSGRKLEEQKQDSAGSGLGFKDMLKLETAKVGNSSTSTSATNTAKKSDPFKKATTTSSSNAKPTLQFKPTTATTSQNKPKTSSTSSTAKTGGKLVMTGYKSAVSGKKK